MNPYYSQYNMPDEMLSQHTGGITHHSLNANKPYEVPRVTATTTVKPKKTKREGVGLRKAPGAPKRFKSSYILFFMAKQKEIKEELGEGASVGEISKRSSEKWKSLSQEDRAIWEAKAEEDKERYNLEKEKYTGPWQVPWKRAKKNPNAPKRPMSAFLFFSQDKRRAIKDANPDMRNTEISRVLGEMWKKATAEERAPHIEREAAEREKYKVAIAKWREDEAVRRRESAIALKEKVMESASMEDKVQSSHKITAQRASPLPIQGGTSPLPIHHQSRPASPGPVPSYYNHGSYGYPAPNYAAPPPPPQYHSYAPYQQQQSPQSQAAYYHNYPPVPPPEYQQRHYQDYAAVPHSGSLDEPRPRDYEHAMPATHYGSYYPPNVPYSNEPLPQSLPQSNSNVDAVYSNEYPPPL